MNIKLKTLQECLNHIQINLVSPKDKRTDFGSHYKYRHIEDIFMALKPLLKDTGCVVTASDSVEQVGDRYYIQSTVTISKGDESVSSVGIARETESKKGMDDAQLSGACSSYSRKYAICGLLAIDSNDDIDAMDNAYTITDTQKDVYQESLHHEVFKGEHQKMDKWWGGFTTCQQAEKGLVVMQKRIDVHDDKANVNGQLKEELVQ